MIRKIPEYICNNIIESSSNLSSLAYTTLNSNDINHIIDIPKTNVYTVTNMTSSGSYKPITCSVKKQKNTNDVCKDNVYKDDIECGKFEPIKKNKVFKKDNTKTDKDNQEIDKDNQEIDKNNQDTQFNYNVEKESYFKHLDFAGQTYSQHFYAAMGYSWRSMKCSFYFFWHAIWPDIFQQSGSDGIINLGDELIEKIRNRMNYLTGEDI